MEKLKVMLEEEETQLADLIAKGNNGGCFLSHYGMTLEHKLIARLEAIRDVRAWIAEIEGAPNA